MPIVTRVEVKNFRACKSLDVELGVFTPIVGYNNAGKTAILDAIQWAVEPSSLGEKDFNDKSQPVEVVCWIEGVGDDVLDKIDAKHKPKLERCIQDGKCAIKIVQSEPNLSATKLLRYILDYGQPPNEDDSWRNPTGIKEAMQVLFPEVIRMRAMSDAAEDVGSNKTSTTIGKIIKLLSKGIESEHGEQLKAAVEQLHDLLAADGGSRSNILSAMDTAVTTSLSEMFSGFEVSIHIPPPQLDSILKSGTIRIKENGVYREISQMGHGLQRATQLALVRVLSERTTGAVSVACNMILIDEPELYLHPQAIEIVKSALRKLSVSGFQIVFSTHSPHMISQENMPSTVIVYKDSEGSNVRPTMRQALGPVEEKQLASAASVIYSLNHLSYLPFCEKALIAEGKTERYLLPIVYHGITGKTLLENKIAPVELGGSGSTIKAMKILSRMGIKAMAIVDLDWAFRHACDVDEVVGLSELVSEAKLIMEALSGPHDIKVVGGLPENNGSVTAAKAWEIFASDIRGGEISQTIHEMLKAEGIWVWPKGTIETHLGLDSKNNAAWAKFKADVSEKGIQSCVEDQDCLDSLVAWVSMID